MKKLILNGSPRQGNTVAAINAFMGSEEKDFEIINLKAKKIAPCKACLFCKNEGNCIDKDDTNEVMDKVEEADFILFATPVYWWGMTAQLKQVIDKCYCRGLQLKEKKIGLIVVGGSPLDNIQYELICKQFDCMASYLSWDMLFQKCYYANARDELAKDVDAIQKLENLGKNV